MLLIRWTEIQLFWVNRCLKKVLIRTPLSGPVVLDSTGSGFLSLLSVFSFCGRVPCFHRKISRQDRLGATILNSVDPQHPLLEAHFTFSKLDRGFVRSAGMDQSSHSKRIWNLALSW